MWVMDVLGQDVVVLTHLLFSASDPPKRDPTGFVMNECIDQLQKWIG